MAAINPPQGESIDINLPPEFGFGALLGQNTSLTVFSFTPPLDCIIILHGRLTSTSGSGQVELSLAFTDENGNAQTVTGAGINGSPTSNQFYVFRWVKGGNAVTLSSVATGTALYYDYAYNYTGYLV